MASAQWAIVQHSGYGYAGDETFAKGLEPRGVDAKEAAKVEKAGGILFDSYGEADDFAFAAMYPEPDMDNVITMSIVPNAQGTFSNQAVDGLRIYIPVRVVKG